MWKRLATIMKKPTKGTWMKRLAVIAYCPFFWADAVFAVAIIPPPKCNDLGCNEVDKLF
jgi:hypothetical protein